MLCRFFAVTLLVVGLVAESAHGGFALQSLSSFGGGDGWLTPTENPNLTITGFQRGLAYNGATNQLYLADRATTSVQILNGTTGANVGSLNMAGVTGGTFSMNMIGVGGDGAVYMGNLVTAATNNFKVYRWENNAAAPTVAFDSAVPFARTGDSFAVIGSGASTRIVSSGSGSTGIALLTTTNGTTFTSSAVAAPTSSVRLGLDFVDANTVVGKQTASSFTSVDLTTAAVTTAPQTSAGEAPLAYSAAERLLASVDVNSNIVRLYDATNLGSLSLLSSLNNTSTFVANGNATGDLAFGVGPDGLRLYALNSNNGIQAFQVVAIPEPSSILLVGLAGVGLYAGRRRRKIT